MGAAKAFAIAFNTMPDNPAAAVVAFGRQGVNRAFETVEGMRFARHHYFEAFVVVVSADFALCHDPAPFGTDGKDCRKCGTNLLWTICRER